MDSTATNVQCQWCHPGSASYTTGHMDGFIKVSSHMKGSSLVTTYNNSTSSFPRTWTPSLGSCTNVSCHFERTTPTWGSTKLSSPAGCSTCHGAPPSGGDTGAAGSHSRHDTYYTGATRCGQCHSNHVAEANPFAHATSAAARPLSLTLRDPSGSAAGSYNGTRINYLPKSQTKIFGTCSNTYCHSTGTAVATGTLAANTTVVWGSGALSCDKCHGNPPVYNNGSPKKNSHSGHSVVHPFKCNACHAKTTADGITISDISKHVNKVYDLDPGPGVTFTYTYAHTGGSCTNISCHSNATWGGSISGGGTGCDSCHGHSEGFEYASGKFSQGKGTWKSHATHTQANGANVRGPNIACDGCHDLTKFPYFKAGNDLNGDGKITLNETTVCDTCHSPAGVYNGISDSQIGARPNWKFSIYSGNSLRAGKANWCLTCHDNSRALIGGKYAPNKAGDGTSYGYNVTGHGKSSTFARLSLQDLTANGNPGANRGCMDCHDSAIGHINSGLSGSRLKMGYENDRKNSNCVQCHKQGGIADHSPRWFTTFNSYSASAHGNTRCRDCHEVHGASGPYTGMMRADKEMLCYQCHRSGVVENDPLSASGLPNSIHAVFTMATSFKHGLGAAMNINGMDYKLQCASCHNVHLVTGRYTSVTVGKTPVTRFGSFTTLWGAATGQKMNDYAGAQTYQSPKGEFDGSVAPDYASFCTECHNATNTIQSPSLGRALVKFNWRAEKHGNYLALDNQPTFSGMTTPYRDNRLGSYVMSCTDCHEAHGSKNQYLMRTNVNTKSVTGIKTGGGKQWSALCSKCHQNVNYMHHSQANASNRCLECHGANDGTSYVNCAQCHSHKNMGGDVTAPAASGLSPVNGTTNVPVSSQLQITLSDSESGIDWSTFSISLAGNKGYSRTYGASSPRVARTNNVNSVLVTVSPEVFGSVEIITVTASVKDFAGNSLVAPAWSFTSKDISIPTRPTMGVPTALTANSIRWNFTDRSSNEDGFKVHDASHAVKASQETPNLSYLDEMGLAPNTQYTRHVHSYNYGGDSVGSSNGSKYTLSAPSNVTANKTAGSWYTTNTAVFTNAAGFGSGGVQYYRYVWDQNPTYVFTETETQWSTGTLTKTSTSDGNWYLHVKSYNFEHLSNGTADYGPFGYDSTPPPQVNILSGVTPSYQDSPRLYGLTITWYRSIDAGSGTVGYKVERAPDVNGSPGSFTFLTDWPDGGNTQMNDTTCTPTTKYWYRVRAYDTVGHYGAYSNSIMGQSFSPPPGNVAATDGTYADRIVLNWTQTGTSGGFSVYRNYPKNWGGSVLVCSVPQGTTTCTDTVTGVYTYYVYANNNQVYPVSDIGYTSGAVPSTPTAGTPTPLSTTSIRWNFSDTAPNETGFRVHDSANTVKSAQTVTNLGYLDEAGLVANTQYVRHLHAFNTNGDSTPTADITAWTQSPAPSVSANRPTDTWYNTPPVTFTNNLAFGPGAVGRYRYQWARSSVYYPGYSEPEWTSGPLALNMGYGGRWYLHLTSLNDGGFNCGTVTFGPYNLDKDAPYIIYATSPFRDAMYVATYAKITVPFSESQSGVDTTSATVQLRGSKGYSKDYAGTSPAFSFSGDGWTTTLTITPDAPFSTQEVITVTVQAKDLAGNLMAPFTWSFTTM